MSGPVRTCDVPGCHEPVANLELAHEPPCPELHGLCCKSHSRSGPLRGRYLPNDGIIDWQAVARAVEGIIPVRTTRTEELIAAATLAYRGFGYNQIFVHFCHEFSHRSIREMRSIAAALKEAA